MQPSARAAAAALAVALIGAGVPPEAQRIDGQSMVALAPLAKRLNIPLKRVDGGVALRVDGAWVQVRANDITLREDGAPMLRLTSFPTIRAGRLLINSADIPAVLDADASIRGSRVILTKSPEQHIAESADGLRVTEIAAPHTPLPASRLQAAQRQSSPRIAIGTVSAAVYTYAQQTNYDALLDGGGAHFHTTLYANGMAGSRTSIGGTLRIGDAGNRHLALGGVNDPLYGQVFTGGGANGIEGVNARGTFLSYSTTTIDARHVLAAGIRTGDWVREVALTDRGGMLQPLVGLQRWNETPSFVFDREIWAGLHGFGAGLRYRTTGRVYADVRAAFAGGGLPLVTGDALTQATLGYDFSTAFGVRAGYGVAHAQRGEAVLQIYGGGPGASFTLSRYGEQSEAGLELARNADRLHVQYLRSPGYGAVQSDGTLAAAGGAIETRTYFASGSGDVAADYRFSRDRASLTLGLESVHAPNGGRTGPTIGYLFPVAGSLSLGFEYHPLANGNGIRLSASQSLYARPVAARRSILVRAPKSGDPLFLYVDGARVQQVSAPEQRVAIDAGSHYVSLRTSAGDLGSPEQRVVDGTPAVLTLPLWPLATVRGTLRLSDIPIGMAKPSLQDVTLILQPEGVSTQTESDGSFEFPTVALDPATQLAVESDTLPPGFTAGSGIAVPSNSDPLTIVIHPSTKIEKVIF